MNFHLASAIACIRSLKIVRKLDRVLDGSRISRSPRRPQAAGVPLVAPKLRLSPKRAGAALVGGGKIDRYRANNTANVHARSVLSLSSSSHRKFSFGHLPSICIVWTSSLSPANLFWICAAGLCTSRLLLGLRLPVCLLSSCRLTLRWCALSGRSHACELEMKRQLAHFDTISAKIYESHTNCLQSLLVEEKGMASQTKRRRVGRRSLRWRRKCAAGTKPCLIRDWCFARSALREKETVDVEHTCKLSYNRAQPLDLYFQMIASVGTVDASKINDQR